MFKISKWIEEKGGKLISHFLLVMLPLFSLGPTYIHFDALGLSCFLLKQFQGWG